MSGTIHEDALPNDRPSDTALEMVEDCGEPYCPQRRRMFGGDWTVMTEYNDRPTMEQMREHLVRADGELESPSTSWTRDPPRVPRWI
jgi:hypothetical protein